MPSELNSPAEALREFVQCCPAGFAPPVQLIQTMRAGFPDVEPWMWLPQLRQSMAFWSETVRMQFPYLVLVPFAKDTRSDDVFCLAGNDASGDPAVLVIHTFTTPGWEYRGRWRSYAEWWLDAQDLHGGWLVEMAEDGE